MNSFDKLILLIKKYYSREGNGAGGNLHIILDDGNMEDDWINYCKQECIKKKDKDGVIICNKLLKLSYKEKQEILIYYPKYCRY